MAEQNHPKSLASIQCMRAVAALMVVLCHVSAVGELYLGQSNSAAWGMYGVDVFFVISGFVMTYTSANLWGKRGQARPFLLRRIFRIYPIYWQFTFVIILMLWLKPELMHMTADHKPSVIKSLLLWPQWTDPLLGVGWSLVYEMYFYVIFALALAAPVRWVKPLAWVWGIFLGISFAIQLTVQWPDMLAYPEFHVISSPLALEFLMGCVLASHFMQGRRLPVLGLILFAIVWAVLMPMIPIIDDADVLRVLNWGVPSAALIYALLMLETYHEIAFPNWLILLGDASYSLYLSHPLILSGLGKLWQRFHMNGALFVLAGIVLPVAFAWANYRLFERPVTRWCQRRFLPK